MKSLVQLYVWDNVYQGKTSFMGVANKEKKTTYSVLVSKKLVGTLQSDSGDVHVAEKKNSHHFKLFRDYLNLLMIYEMDHIFQFALLLKRRGFWLELKRGERAQVRTEMVEFIALPFPFPSKLKIWSFHVVVVQWRQRNVQKSVMHVQSYCFAH